MVDVVSWVVVGVIALFSIVGFSGVVAASVLTVVRRVRGTAPAPHVAAPARAERREPVGAGSRH